MATKKSTIENPFRTKYSHRIYFEGEPWRKAFRTPTGEKIQIEHTPHMGLDGRRKLVKDNPKPIYEMIQASREQCEIERIVKRALNGDTSVLNAMEGQYIDITGAPSSLAQAQQIIINAKRQFEELDTETKKKFDNNVEIFIAEAGTQEWLDKMGISDQIERAKQAEAHKAEYEKNLHDAMANLAKSSNTEHVTEGGDKA